jgi:hypothetical protein
MSTAAITPVCQFGGQPAIYMPAFVIYINQYHVLTIYTDARNTRVLFIESTQLGRRDVLSPYETPLDTIQRLYRCSPEELPSLRATYRSLMNGGVFTPQQDPYEKMSWSEVMSESGIGWLYEIYIVNPLFQRQPVATPPPRAVAAPAAPAAPLRVHASMNAPLRPANVRRNLNDEFAAQAKRTFTFSFEEEEEEEEPIGFLELRSGTKVFKYK